MTIMDEQAEQFGPTKGEQATAAANRAWSLTGEVVHWRRIATRLLRMLDTHGVSLDASQTDAAPMAECTPNDGQYDVRVGKKGMGS